MTRSSLKDYINIILVAPYDITRRGIRAPEIISETILKCEQGSCSIQQFIQKIKKEWQIMQTLIE